MKKSFVIIVSVFLVIISVVMSYRYLTKGQVNPQLDIVSLDEINNTSSFLWLDPKQDEITFNFFGIKIQRIESEANPYFEIIFAIKDKENATYSPKGFNFSSNIGKFTNNTLKVTYADLVGNEEIEVKLKVNTDVVDEGNYFLDLELNNGSFDITEFDNNGKNYRLSLAINEKPASLKIWLNIFLVILLVSLGLWFLLLKRIYYPTFSQKGQLNISEPDMSTIFLNKNARQLIIGNKLKEKENIFKKILFGKIQHELQSTTHSIVITPYEDWKTKKILYRLTYKGETNSEIVNSESYLKHLDKYKLKTEQEVFSFEYFNIKH